MNNYEKGPNQTQYIQNVILENRKKAAVSGVKDVLSFDDQMIILDTDLGILTLKGNDLRINKLSTDTKEVKIIGEINSLAYSVKHDKNNDGIVRRLFK